MGAQRDRAGEQRVCWDLRNQVSDMSRAHFAFPCQALGGEHRCLTDLSVETMKRKLDLRVVWQGKRQPAVANLVRDRRGGGDSGNRYEKEQLKAVAACYGAAEGFKEVQAAEWKRDCRSLETRESRLKAVRPRRKCWVCRPETGGDLEWEHTDLGAGSVFSLRVYGLESGSMTQK